MVKMMGSACGWITMAEISWNGVEINCLIKKLENTYV